MSKVVISCNIIVLRDYLNEFMQIECLSNVFALWSRLDNHF